MGVRFGVGAEMRDALPGLSQSHEMRGCNDGSASVAACGTLGLVTGQIKAARAGQASGAWGGFDGYQTP